MTFDRITPEVTSAQNSTGEQLVSDYGMLSLKGRHQPTVETETIPMPLQLPPNGKSVGNGHVYEAGNYYLIPTDSRFGPHGPFSPQGSAYRTDSAIPSWDDFIARGQNRSARLVDPCGLAPCHLGQAPELVSKPVAKPQPQPSHDWLAVDFVYRAARGLGIGYVISKTYPHSLGSIGQALGVAFADGAIDDLAFAGVKRGPISMAADAVSLGCAFLPQPQLMRTAEMIGVHAAGRYVESKYETYKR